MNRRARLKSFCIGIARAATRSMLLFMPWASSAQSPLRYQHISVAEGLSQNSVNFIMEDRYGFVWLATGDGLNRYDGKEVIVHKSRFGDSAKTHLLDRNINSRLAEDAHGRIWMAPDAGVSYFDYRHSKYSVVVDKAMGTTVVLGIKDNIVWVAAPRVGVTAINTHDLTHTFFPFSERYQLDSFHSYQIFMAAILGDGLWMVDAKGLLYFDLRTHKDTRVLTRDGLYSTCLLRDNRILLTTNDSVIIYEPLSAKATTIPVTTAGTRQEWRHCVEDVQTGIVYLGSRSGLVAKLDITTGNYETFDFQKSQINSLFIGRSRNLWVGTEGDGAYKLDIKPPKFNSYTPFNQNGVTNGFMVKSIHRDEAGKIWMGTADKGLWRYDLQTNSEKNIPLPEQLSGKQVGAIIMDSSGLLVIAAANSLYWLDEAGNVKKRATLPLVSSSSLEKPITYCIAEWKKDHYVVGTNLGIYSVNAEEHDIRVRFPLSISRREWGGWIYGFSKQPDGSIYAGKRSGFVKLRVINDTSLQALYRGLDNMVVRHFYRSVNKPILWVASEIGLIAYNEQTKQVQAFDERSGLGNSNIYAILPQTDSVLWVSTNRGISRVAVHSGKNTLKIDVTNYTSTDGLQSEEFNTGAYFRSQDGTLIFGGISGINWFNPMDIVPNPYVALPAIAALYINDILFAGDTANYIKSISLPYNKNTISFNLRALEYTQPEENMFAYKLEGLESDWVYTTSDKARYSNLLPGSYTFLLKARNNEGLWYELPFKMQITIRPPYWQTWWFRLSAVLLSIGVIAFVTRYFISQKVKAKTLQLEKQQALNMERLRISKDVHDDLGAGLSKIALMAEMAQKQVLDDVAIGNDIRHISTVSKDLIDNMRDLIWVLNPENTTLDNLVARIREYTVDYLDGFNIEAALNFPDNVPEISISREAQRNIFSTVKEAVHNVVKHAGASRIAITLQLDETALDITITDNGKGLGSGPKKGNGLCNMAHRIKSIGGDCTIGAGKSGGTTVAINVPLMYICVGHSYPQSRAARRENTTKV